MTHLLLALNLAPCLPFCWWMIRRAKYRGAIVLPLLTALLSLLWPLPPVPMLAALTIALSLRRCWQLTTW